MRRRIAGVFTGLFLLSAWLARPVMGQSTISPTVKHVVKLPATISRVGDTVTLNYVWQDSLRIRMVERYKPVDSALVKGLRDSLAGARVVIASLQKTVDSLLHLPAPQPTPTPTPAPAPSPSESYPNRPASYTKVLTRLDQSQAVPAGDGERYLAGFNNTWSIVGGSGTTTRMDDPTAVTSPPSVWRVYEAKGSYGTGTPGTGGSSSFGRWGLPINAPSLYVSVWVKWSPGFVHHPVSEKFLRLAINNEAEALLIQSSHNGNFLRASNEQIGVAYEPQNGAQPTSGVWHRIEVLVVRGQNGSLKAWLDGQLRLNYSGPMATAGNFTTFEIHSTRGGGGETLTADQWFMVDDVFLATP